MSDIGYLTISIHLAGKNFYPTKLINKYGYKVHIIDNPGELIKSGRNKGKLSNEGFCYFEFDNSLKYENITPEAVRIYKIIEEDNTKEKYNIDYTSFSLLFTGCQGNMELSNEELKLLYSLNCGISMNYISADDYDYRKQRKLNRLTKKFNNLY